MGGKSELSHPLLAGGGRGGGTDDDTHTGTTNNRLKKKQKVEEQEPVFIKVRLGLGLAPMRAPPAALLLSCTYF